RTEPVEVARDAREPRAGHRLGAGLDAGDAPVARRRLVIGDLARLREIDGEVRRQRGEVEEVAPDHVAQVAEAQDEVLVPVPGVKAHDVPEDRGAADLDHRLGLALGLLAEARALTAAQNHDRRRHRRTSSYTASSREVWASSEYSFRI